MTLEINELSVHISVNAGHSISPPRQTDQRPVRHIQDLNSITDEVVRRCVTEVMSQLHRHHIR
jgi:Family of unknown function (DUF5908)